MTSFKQSIAWTAVLLYHRLKLAATLNNRRRLVTTTFCTEVLHKLASFFRTSVEYISTIVGINGRNTKRIYNRALIDSRFYEIEFYLCKKADNRIFNYNAIATTTITTQFQSPKSFYALCHVASNCSTCTVPTSQTGTDEICSTKDNSASTYTNRIDDNTIHNTPPYNADPPHMVHHHKHHLPTKYTKITTRFNSIFGSNRRSSSRIAIKNSLSSYKQSIIQPQYPELVLVMNHLPSSDMSRVHVTNMHPNSLSHRQYIGEWKQTNTGSSNLDRQFHRLHTPRIDAKYGLLNNRFIQYSNVISNASDFETIQFIVKKKPVTVTRGIFPLPLDFNLDNYVTSYNYFFNNGLRFKKCKRSTCSLYGSTAFGCNHPYLFYDEIKRKLKVLPRLNSICKPGKIGWTIMNSPMIKKMAANAYILLLKHCPELIEPLDHAISIIPQELRFIGTPFTGLAFVGSLADGNNRPHLDKDLASIIITLGNNISGGRTRYYNPVNFKSNKPESSKGKCVAEVCFVHGQYQIAPFHNVVHSGSKWIGQRGVLSFFVTQNIYNHFNEYGDTRYNAARNRMYGTN